MKSEHDKIQEILTSYKKSLVKEKTVLFQKAKLKGNFKLIDSKGQYPSSVLEALNCIHANIFDQNLDVGWLKKECRINKKVFSSVFYKYLKYYPKEYILHHRLTVSKKLLLTVDTSITFIAHSVGFTSLSSFCKTFKRKEGKKPSTWKREVSKNGKRQ
ncbi:MAG: helix-turn-helix transcriptional regulator [Balneolaceae bacterium]|nr:helix-turn-helix transcriptional regulator [Balneolaceae bacterium]